MKRFSRILCAGVLAMSLILDISDSASAQPRSRMENPQARNFMHGFSSWIINSTKDSVTISFTYSVPYSGIIFIKHAMEIAPLKSTFDAILTFSIDAVDSATGINYHDFHLKKISTGNFDVTQSSKLFAEDVITLTLPKSFFKAEWELRDDSQQITYFSETRQENLTSKTLATSSEFPPGLGEESPDILSTMFLDSLSKQDIYPYLQNNTAPFPHTIIASFLVEDTDSTPLTFKLETMKGVLISKLDSLAPLKAVLQPTVQLYGTRYTKVDRINSIREDTGNSADTGISIISFVIVPDPNHSLYIARFPVDTLQEGRYTIETTIGGKTEKTHFTYMWIDEPLTLRDFPTALSLLKYIVNDSVFSYISSGNDQEEKEKFDAYWKSRNPTPESAFNPLEDEFYQRADYAFEHFKSISEDNGAATDRGKAYILFGKPAQIKRDFRSDGTYEIWYYPNLKKSLVFKEQGGSDFKLYQTENL